MFFLNIVFQKGSFVKYCPVRIMNIFSSIPIWFHVKQLLYSHVILCIGSRNIGMKNESRERKMK